MTGLFFGALVALCIPGQVVGTLDHVCTYDDYMTNNMDTLGHCGDGLTDLVMQMCGEITTFNSTIRSR